MPPTALRRILTTSARPLSQSITPKHIPSIPRRYKSGPYGYTQAKALVYSKYGEPADVLSLHTHSISPSLPSNHLLLRTLSAPINPADINQIQGVYPSRPPFTPLLGTPQPSAVAGNEGCFEILQVGPNTPSHLSKGDWVIPNLQNFGTFRTHVLTPASEVMKIENKDGLTPIQVGTVSVNPVTAYRMLKDFVNIKEGEWVIQNGGNSGVGRAVVQLGRIWGFKTLSIIRDRETPSETESMKKELEALGATKVITETQLLSKEFLPQIKEWTTSTPIPLALNCIGGKSASSLAKLLSPKGHMVTYGAMSKKPVELPTGLLIFKDISFHGFWVSRWGMEHLEEKRRTVHEVLGWIREGRFRDSPVEEIGWEWGSGEEVLKKGVQGTLGGFRRGKGVFVFGET